MTVVAFGCLAFGWAVSNLFGLAMSYPDTLAFSDHINLSVVYTSEQATPSPTPTPDVRSWPPDTTPYARPLVPGEAGTPVPSIRRVPSSWPMRLFCVRKHQIRPDGRTPAATSLPYLTPTPDVRSWSQ